MNEQARKWAGPARAVSAEQLADRHAVGELCKIYALGMDMRDYDLVRSAFADDAMIDGEDGSEPVDESMAKTYAIASSFKSTQHLIGQQYVDLQGDEAVVWSYGVAHHKVATGEDRDELIAGVHYRDRCRRRDGGWLIVHRSIKVLWVDLQPRVSKM